MSSPTASTSAESAKRHATELFVVSVLVLFVELACIRWFPAHVFLLTFFTNSVLLACFLGMSIGCLAASHKTSYIRWTAPLLILGMVISHAAEILPRIERIVSTGDNDVVFFGAEKYADAARFVIPVEVLCGLMFVLIALANVGPGQELGRALDRVPDRVRAYTINIAGSIAGIVLFGLSSYLELGPLFWFTAVAGIVAWFIMRDTRERGETQTTAGKVLAFAPLALVVILASWRSGSFGFDRKEAGTTYWSPYYRLDYTHPPKSVITVNQIGHQKMEPLDVSPEYNVTHLLWRDVQRLAGQQPKPFQNVLVIGAGSGNDLSRALQFNVGHIDAVDIDPVIQRLGRQDHPAKPYSDPRVTAYNDDGRNFLRSTDKKYDLIVYALVDSLVLHSSYSNIRLESYLFTKEAFEDVRRHLAPGGLFATYNFFRQGWVLGRVEKTVRAAFDADPLVMMLPYRERVQADDSFQTYTIFLSGEKASLEPLKNAFAQHPAYWVDAKNALPDAERNGFLDAPSPEDQQKEASRWIKLGKAEIVPPAGELALATDDWPFLYLRAPMLPMLNLRAAGIMAALALAMLFFFERRGRAERAKKGLTEVATPFDWRMFFLGAGFMLVETKAVVRMALLLGSTWMVNSVVFFAVLVVILLANVIVLKARPKNMTPFYVGLVLALLAGVFVPLDAFLGMPRAQQILLASTLVVMPIFFAGFVFAVSFAKTKNADRAFGANIAGAMLGGLAEYTSMRLGFQKVGYVALAFYVLAIVVGMLADSRAAASSPVAKTSKKETGDDEVGNELQVPEAAASSPAGEL